jgi:hypothetical protein
MQLYTPSSSMQEPWFSQLHSSTVPLVGSESVVEVVVEEVAVVEGGEAVVGGEEAVVEGGEAVGMLQSAPSKHSQV